jgi:hypothetical protein
MDGALFVPRQDVPQPRAHLFELVIDVQDGAAGITEDGVHALVDQRFQKYSGAAHGLLAIEVSGGQGAINFVHQHEISPENAKAVILLMTALISF